jgi:hypothetical protein
MKRQEANNRGDSPATLVAIIVAARQVGDRELERETRRQLEERFRVKLSFARDLASKEGVSHVR